MPITAHWCLHDHAILVKYEGIVELNEIQDTVQHITLMIESSSLTTIHVLHDVGSLQSVTPGVPLIYKTIQQISTGAWIGHVVAYNFPNRLIKFVGHLLVRLSGTQHYRIVPSYEAAVAWLVEHDTELATLLNE